MGDKKVGEKNINPVRYFLPVAAYECNDIIRVENWNSYTFKFYKGL